MADTRWTKSSFAANIFLICVLFTTTVIFADATEQLTVSYAPEFLKFRAGELIRSSQLPDIFSAVQGFSTLKDLKWDGLESGNPLKRPEAIVAIEVEGFGPLELDIPGTKFPLDSDVEPGWIYQLTADRTYVRFAESRPILMEVIDDESVYAVKSQYPVLLKTMPVRPSELQDLVFSKASVLNGNPPVSLNLTLTPDMKFLLDLQLLLETAKIIEEKSKFVHNGVPDVYWFRVTGLQELLSIYGKNDPQIQEAMKILVRTLEQVKKYFVNAYDGNVLVVVMAVDYQTGYSVRLGRSILQAPTGEPTPEDQNIHNIAKSYDPLFPVAFNIILFVTLLFTLSIFAVSMGIWHMDPGRDSIIYRMTSQRIKKDQ